MVLEPQDGAKNRGFGRDMRKALRSGSCLSLITKEKTLCHLPFE